MHVVGINKANNKIFESQAYSNELERVIISTLIELDASIASVEVDVVTMTSKDLANFQND